MTATTTTSAYHLPHWRGTYRSHNRNTRKVTTVSPKPAQPAPTPTPEPAPTPEPGATAPAATEYDWSELAAPVAMPNKLNVPNTHVDVIGTIPEAIRQRAETSLTVNAARVAAKAGSTAKRSRIDYHWSVQPVASKEMGAKFVALLAKYAKHRPSDVDVPHAGPDSPKGQVTARTGEPAHYVKGADGVPEAATPTADGAFLGVRYSVRPFEQRKDTARMPNPV